MNLPLATSSSLLGHVSKQGSCYEDNSPGKAKKSPDFLPCYWQNESFPNELYRVTATLRSVSHRHTHHTHKICSHLFPGFPFSSVGKGSACSAGDLGLIPGLGRAPGEGNGNPLQYPCLENLMDRGAWWAAVHGVSKSRTRLSY